MDLPDTRHPEASPSSSSAPASNLAQQHSSPAQAPTPEPKPLRSSARVKAAQEQKSKAKGKGKANEHEQGQAQDQSSSSSALPPVDSAADRSTRNTTSASKPKRTREGASAKGKAKETTDESQSAPKRCVPCLSPGKRLSSLTIYVALVALPTPVFQLVTHLWAPRARNARPQTLSQTTTLRPPPHPSDPGTLTNSDPVKALQ
jgi:hypothetical protein